VVLRGGGGRPWPDQTRGSLRPGLWGDRRPCFPGQLRTSELDSSLSPLAARAVFKIVVLPYKVFHGLAPQYLGPLDHVADLPGRRALRSSGTIAVWFRLSGCQPSPTGCRPRIYRVGQKTGLFLKVYNFATVGGRNAYYMSKFSKFYLENEYITGMSVR